MSDMAELHAWVINQNQPIPVRPEVLYKGQRSRLFIEDSLLDCWD